MYKRSSKFQQGIRQRGGTLTKPFKKSKIGCVESIMAAAIERAALQRKAREWKRYIAECRNQGFPPAGKLPPKIKYILEKEKFL